MRTVLLAALAGIVSTPALAIGRLADVTVIDRDTGRTLHTHFHKGDYWVAGRPGAHYAIQIRSQNHRRLLAVTSVDGVNVLTGDTAAFDQRGYIYDPWVGYDIAGWRKSASQIAAFTFTSVPKSYAARTGRPDNVGVIGVALFRERAHEVAQHSLPEPVSPAAEVSAPVVREQSARSESGEERDASARDEVAVTASRAAAPSLGTGHGRSERSWVTHVAFERAQSQPDEIIRIRYDSRANLVAMGVIPPPARPAPPRRPDAFPDASRMGYVPDP